MNRHLVAVVIGVESGADQRVNLDGLAFHQNRLECLNAEAVQSGSTVQQYGMVLNDFFEDVPYDRLLLFHHFLRLLDRCAVSGRSEEHTSELQSQSNLVCRLLLEKKKK